MVIEVIGGEELVSFVRSHGNKRTERNNTDSEAHKSDGTFLQTL